MGILIPVLTSASAFGCINFLSSWTVPSSIVGHTRVTKWKSCLVSCIHSLVIGCAAVYTFYHLIPKALIDLKFIHNDLAVFVVGASIGYFVYDACYLLTCPWDRECVEFLVHHAIVIVCMVTSLLTKQFISVVILGLFVEVNSVFFHVRELLLMVGVSRESLIFRCNSFVNIVTCLIFRLGVQLWILRWNLINCDCVDFPGLCARGLPIVLGILSAVMLYRFVTSDWVDSGCKKRVQVTYREMLRTAVSG